MITHPTKGLFPRGAGLFASFCVVCTLALCLPLVAAAQMINIDANSLMQRLDRIEQRMSSQPAPPAAPQANATFTNRIANRPATVLGNAQPTTIGGVRTGAGNNMAADYEVRLQGLENENRNLLGAIERLQNSLDKGFQKLDLRVRDMEMRLNDLEKTKIVQPPVRPTAPNPTGTPFVIQETITPTSPVVTPTTTAPSTVIGANGRPVSLPISSLPTTPNTPLPGQSGQMAEVGSLPAAAPAIVAGAANTQSAILEERTPVAIAPSIPAAPETAYKQAYDLVIAKDFPQAQTELESFIANHGGHKLADNAYYWLGEVHLAESRYKEAVIAFRDGLKTFPDGQKAPANLLKMGVALQQMNQGVHAKAAWNKLLADFPQAPEAAKARVRLQQIS